MITLAVARSTGDKAIIFKTKGRTEEGKVLSMEEIELMGYEFGIIIREPDYEVGGQFNSNYMK